METRDFALRVVTSRNLEEKLRAAPHALTDDAPGAPLRLEGPGRPAGLEIAPAARARVPPVAGMADPAQRVRILHALANHELQAAELFAWALLAFPDAPPAFRRGLAAILDDEQRHTRMYAARLRELGAALGDFPVSGYFWSKARSWTTPARFVCAMGLTFENANLDYTHEYAAAARAACDRKTAALIDAIGRDEMEHVRFGWRWLSAWKRRDESMWAAYNANVAWPLRAALARGRVFQRERRAAIGMDEDFIARLEATSRDAAPRGRARAP